MSSSPRLDFEPFDTFEFPGVGCDEGGSEAAGLGGDEKIERANGPAGLLQCRTDVGIMQGGIEGKIREPKEAKKSFETIGLVRMRLEVLFHAGPEFGGDNDWNAGQRGIGQFFEASLVAEHGNARAGIQEKGRLHGAAGLELNDGSLMPGWPGRRFGKVSAIGKLLGEVSGDFGERSKFRRGQWLEHDLVAMLFDQHLGPVEAESLWQADRLASSVLEDFCNRHSYRLYLCWFNVKRREPRGVHRTVPGGGCARLHLQAHRITLSIHPASP